MVLSADLIGQTNGGPIKRLRLRGLDEPFRNEEICVLHPIEEVEPDDIPELDLAQALASEVVSAACNRSGLKRRKAMISGRTPAPTAHLHQSLRSASSSRWTKRFLRGRGIAKCTPRSDAVLPAAMTRD